MSVDAFFAFARERHAITLRRCAGQSAPWTEDPILQQYRFTSVFRELDRTTVWFREHVRNPHRDAREVLLATVLFRWFNRITTGEAIWLQPDLDGRTAWERRLDNRPHEWMDTLHAAITMFCGRGPYVTGSYIIKTPDGYDKLDGVLGCVEHFMTQRHTWYHTDVHTGTLQEAELGWEEVATLMMNNRGGVSLWGLWMWLRNFPYLGDFMAYEIVTDLRHTALLDQAPDIMNWANPGPGATRGLGRVFEGRKDAYRPQHKEKLNLLMQSLLAASQLSQNWPQRDQSGGLVAHQDYMAQTDMLPPDGSMLMDWPAWEMRDIEHTLCEWDKYMRVKLGEGRPRGVYRHA